MPPAQSTQERGALRGRFVSDGRGQRRMILPNTLLFSRLMRQEITQVDYGAFLSPDLRQRTYCHFHNNNAPVLQMETDEKFPAFVFLAAGAEFRPTPFGL